MLLVFSDLVWPMGESGSTVCVGGVGPTCEPAWVADSGASEWGEGKARRASVDVMQWAQRVLAAGESG